MFEWQEDAKGSEFRVKGGKLLYRSKDGQYQMCVLENKVTSTISHCHTLVLGGYFVEKITLNYIAENVWSLRIKESVVVIIRAIVFYNIGLSLFII